MARFRCSKCGTTVDPSSAEPGKLGPCPQCGVRAWGDVVVLSGRADISTARSVSSASGELIIRPIFPVGEVQQQSHTADAVLTRPVPEELRRFLEGVGEERFIKLSEGQTVLIQAVPPLDDPDGPWTLRLTYDGHPVTLDDIDDLDDTLLEITAELASAFRQFKSILWEERGTDE